MTGVNTYSGGTHINGGTLAVDTDYAPAPPAPAYLRRRYVGVHRRPTGGINRPITLDAGGGTIDTTLGNPTSLVGDITGAGSLTEVGTGTLELFGNNDYRRCDRHRTLAPVRSDCDTGLPSTTAVPSNSGATLSIADSVHAIIGSLADGSSGGGSVVIGIGPTGSASRLIIDGPGSSTFSGTISGPGSLAMDGGSLTLTGAGSHIGGDLDIGACGCSASTLKLVGGSLVVDGAVTRRHRRRRDGWR